MASAYANFAMGQANGEVRCEEITSEGYQALKKTRYIKGYKFSIFLVLLAVPFWVTGMIIDKEQKQPNQVADEILLVIGGALHVLAYFIIEGSGCLLFKGKWCCPTCCCCLFCFCPIRCGACIFGGLWIVVLLGLAAAQRQRQTGKGPHTVLLLANFFSLLGYFLINIIFLRIFYEERIAGKEQPKENNQLELGEVITGEEQPKENNQQAPGEANRKVKPSDSLASKLQELKQAKDLGLMSEAEFQRCKSDLVSGIVGASKTV